MFVVLKSVFLLVQLSEWSHVGLQKTNIIRDYLEDINEIPAPRMFWPREIWGKYATRLEVGCRAFFHLLLWSQITSIFDMLVFSVLA